MYRLVKHDVLTGNTPTHELDSTNLKNRYSILAAVNIKGGTVSTIKSVLIEKCIDLSIFLMSICLLLAS